jgi:hypothetical protein
VKHGCEGLGGGEAAACGHVGEAVAAIACEHVIADHDLTFTRLFTGHGIDSVWACEACSVVKTKPLPIGGICDACLRDIAPMVGSGIRIMGTPETRSRLASLQVLEERVRVAGLDARSLIGLAPVPAAPGRWLAVTDRGELVDIDLALQTHVAITSLGDPARGLFNEREYPGRVEDKREFYARHGPTSKAPNAGYAHWRLTSELAAQLPILVKPDANGQFAALCNRWGRFGSVIDMAAGEPLNVVDRGDYHPEQTQFPIAWIERTGGPLLVHGTAWNRLDIPICDRADS